MSGELHLSVDGRRMAACGGGHGPIFPARGRLVDEFADDGAVGQQRHADGDVEARFGDGTVVSL